MTLFPARTSTVFAFAMLATTVVATLVPTLSQAQGGEARKEASPRLGPTVMPAPIDQGTKLRAALDHLLPDEPNGLGDDGGAVLVEGHQLSYNVVAPLQFDSKRRLVGGTIQVVDDTDPNEAVFTVYTFRPNDRIDLGTSDAVIQRVSWESLGLSTSPK